MGAAGATAALLKRAKEGGSYHVTVSLGRCAMWYQSLGLVPDVERAFSKNFNQQIWNLSDKDLPRVMGELKSRLVEPAAVIRDTSLGRVRRLAPVVTYSTTPAYWNDPILVDCSQRHRPLRLSSICAASEAAAVRYALGLVTE
jgi:hypothetical protein